MKVLIETENIDKKIIPELNRIINEIDKEISLLDSSKIPIQYRNASRLKELKTNLSINKDLINGYLNSFDKNKKDFDNLNEQLMDELISIEQIKIHKN